MKNNELVSFLENNALIAKPEDLSEYKLEYKDEVFSNLLQEHYDGNVLIQGNPDNNEVGNKTTWLEYSWEGENLHFQQYSETIVLKNVGDDKYEKVREYEIENAWDIEEKDMPIDIFNVKNTLLHISQEYMDEVIKNNKELFNELTKIPNDKWTENECDFMAAEAKRDNYGNVVKNKDGDIIDNLFPARDAYNAVIRERQEQSVSNKKNEMDYSRISHTFSNGITVVNITPHPITFQNPEGGIDVIPSSVVEGEKTGYAVVNAKTVEREIAPHIVETQFIGDEQNQKIIDEIKAQFEQADKTGDLMIVGSMIAANTYPDVKGMIPAPGFERVPPAEKRMSCEKFNQGDAKKEYVPNYTLSDQITKNEAKNMFGNGEATNSEHTQKLSIQ